MSIEIVLLGTGSPIPHPDRAGPSTLVRAGEAQVYLPGDIHDTLCVSGPALLFRFTERDLKKEDKEEHRVIRYVERDGGWISGGA